MKPEARSLRISVRLAAVFVQQTSPRPLVTHLMRIPISQVRKTAGAPRISQDDGDDYLDPDTFVGTPLDVEQG